MKNIPKSCLGNNKPTFWILTEKLMFLIFCLHLYVPTYLGILMAHWIASISWEALLFWRCLPNLQNCSPNFHLRTFLLMSSALLQFFMVISINIITWTSPVFFSDSLILKVSYRLRLIGMECKKVVGVYLKEGQTQLIFGCVSCSHTSSKLLSCVLLL